MEDCELTEKKRFIERSCFFTNKDNPFSELQIDDSSFLDNVSERGTCLKCNKSRRYYCYNCYVAVSEIGHRIPKIKLPVKIDIIKHPKEVDGKSTSAHAAVLASEDVRVFTYPNFPNYGQENVLLIFPGESAVELKSVFSDSASDTCSSGIKQTTFTPGESVCICLQSSIPVCDTENINRAETPCKTNISRRPVPFDRVVFIDSTWKQTKRLYRDPQINCF